MTHLVMREGGRIAAAIEVLDEIFARHRPASEALKDWGKAHRFAGAGDRHAIGTLVYDVLRRKNSLAHSMGAASSRALVLAALREIWQRSPDDIARAVEEEHGPGALTQDELLALASESGAEDGAGACRGRFPRMAQGLFRARFRRAGGGRGTRTG